MRIKKYISPVVVILLILFAVVKQQQAIVPNQQVVIQYSTLPTSQALTEQTAALIQQTLLELNVDQVKIKQHADGKLKITYRSDLDVAHIEQALHIAIHASIKANAGTELPVDGESVTYNLDVYELYKSQDVDSGLNGTETLAPQLKGDRFFIPKTDILTVAWHTAYHNSIVTQKLKTIPYYTALAKNNILQHIPEVRAGPYSA